MLAVLSWNLSVTSWELNTMIAVAGSALAAWLIDGRAAIAGGAAAPGASAYSASAA